MTKLPRFGTHGPWLKQTRVIKTQPGLKIDGVGYDSNMRVKENVYKTIAAYWKPLDPKTWWKTYDFATDVWKDRESSEGNKEVRKRAKADTRSSVSLSGNLYWVAFYKETDPVYHVHGFDFSSENFFKFCDLPCQKNHPHDALVLRAFKRDRLSLLKQCHITKKIEIWVTKNNINYDNDVVWMTFMEVSIPNLPDLVHTGFGSQPSYFIDDKRLVLCSCDKTCRAWIYVLEENKLVRKIQIDSLVDYWPLHCTYFPNLVPVPRGQREEADLQL